jgi:hypothetical protein
MLQTKLPPLTVYALAAAMCGIPPIPPMRRERYYAPPVWTPPAPKKRVNPKKAAQKAQRMARRANRK